MIRHAHARWGVVLSGCTMMLIVVGFAFARNAPPVALEATGAGAVEAPFVAENQAAMDKMMAGMGVRPTGDVDRDFIEMMIPHHQGAIDMAQAFLRHGGNEQLRRIAQEIVVEQAQEIAAMRLAVGDCLPASAPAQTQFTPSAVGTAETPTGRAPEPPPGEATRHLGMQR